MVVRMGISVAHSFFSEKMFLFLLSKKSSFQLVEKECALTTFII